MKGKEKKEKVDEIRRKLLKMGVWSLPLIIAFSSRKIWAGTPGPFPPRKGEGDKFFEEEKERF